MIVLRPSTVAGTLVAALLLAAPASAQDPPGGRWPFAPPDPSTPPTCANWHDWNFFERASVELVRECLQAGMDPNTPVAQRPAIISAASVANDPRIITLPPPSPTSSGWAPIRPRATSRARRRWTTRSRPVRSRGCPRCGGCARRCTGGDCGKSGSRRSKSEL